MTSSANQVADTKREEERRPVTIWEIMKLAFTAVLPKREEERRPDTLGRPLLPIAGKSFPFFRRIQAFFRRIQASESVRKLLVMGIPSALSIFALIYAFWASIPLDVFSHKTGPSAYSPPPGCTPEGNLPDELLTTIKVLAGADPETFKAMLDLANVMRNAQCDALEREKNVSSSGPDNPKQPSGPDKPKQPFIRVNEVNLCKDKNSECISLTIHSTPVYLPTGWIWKLPVIAYGTMCYLQPENSACNKEMVCNFVSDMEKYMVPVILTSNSEPCPPAPDNKLKPTIVEAAR